MRIDRIHYPQSERDSIYIVNWSHGEYEQLSAEMHLWSSNRMEENMREIIVAKVKFKLKK